MWVPRSVVVSATGVVFTVFVATGPAGGAGRSDPRTLYARPLNTLDAAAVERAKLGAARRLQEAECLQVLSDFTDPEGRTLDRNLEPWDMSAADYALRLPFWDGRAMPRCRRARVELVATRGMAAVYVCPGGAGAVQSHFALIQARSPALAEAMVIHEVLHTLGLGEDPPSSLEITERVRQRCR
jgi:hypothetical protein